MNYDSNNLIKISDHRPVFAQFELDLGDIDHVETIRNTSGLSSVFT